MGAIIARALRPARSIRPHGEQLGIASARAREDDEFPIGGNRGVAAKMTGIGGQTTNRFPVRIGSIKIASFVEREGTIATREGTSATIDRLRRTKQYFVS